MAVSETKAIKAPRCEVCGTSHDVDQYRIDVFKVLSDEEVFIRQLNLCPEDFERAKSYIIRGLSAPTPQATAKPNEASNA